MATVNLLTADEAAERISPEVPQETGAPPAVTYTITATVAAADPDTARDAIVKLAAAVHAITGEHLGEAGYRATIDTHTEGPS